MFLRHNDSPLYIKRAPHGLFLNHFHAATAAWSLITASTRLSAFRYRDFTSTVRVGAFVHLAFFQSHCSTSCYIQASNLERRYTPMSVYDEITQAIIAELGTAFL